MLTSRSATYAVIAGCFFWQGCSIDSLVSENTGPAKTEDVLVDPPNIQTARIELDMGAGQLNVDGGSKKLVDGSVTYNVPSWRPSIVSKVDGTNAEVTVKQDAKGSSGVHAKNSWNLNLSDRVVTDLNVGCGAGEARLNLGTLSLRHVDVHMGAGKVVVNLDGQPTRDYEVKVNGGVGETEIRLPKGVGVWAEAHKGIGAVNVTGLEKHGDHWENDAYGKAKVTVKLVVDGGVGEIRIAG